MSYRTPNQVHEKPGMGFAGVVGGLIVGTIAFHSPSVRNTCKEIKDKLLNPDKVEQKYQSNQQSDYVSPYEQIKEYERNRMLRR